MEKLNDEKFLKDDGNSEQIAILNKVADFDKFIYDNTLKLKNY